MTPGLLELARAKGTDKEYREFIQKQPSAFSGRFSEYLESGEGRCIAAHYRTAANSGIGCKPEYSCIPLTREEHDQQHRMGQFDFMSKPTWEKLVEKYLRLWLES